MANDIRRPTSVWVAQILIFIFGLILAAPLAVTVPAIFRHGDDVSLTSLLLVAAVNIIITVLFAAAFWGMFRRQAYGRWLGFAMLSLAFILSVVGQFLRPDGSFGYNEPSDPQRSAGTIIAQIMIAALLLALLYQLALGKRVIAFFAPDGSSADASPPTFDET